MAGPTNLQQLVNFVSKAFGGAPKSQTPTYGPASATQEFIARPQYLEHVDDILDTRINDNSEALMKRLFKHDPDVSAAVGAYLTLADTKPMVLVRDFDQQIDREATKQLHNLMFTLFNPVDYAQGYQFKPGLRTWCEEQRYMLLLRGAMASELVGIKKGVPDKLSIIDAASIRWEEKKPGAYKPIQEQADGKRVSLDFPNFFMAFHRRDPTGVYAYSDFVSSINTIAARQTVINTLYRILNVTGFPRITVTILEDVIRKSAPASIQSDAAQMRQWVKDRVEEVRAVYSEMRADQAFVTLDSVKTEIINDKNPGAGLDVSSIIETLNAQNQAGLKTMATVIGRGQQGINTASVEARIAAMNADQLNKPLEEVLSRAFTFLLAQFGVQGVAEVTFPKAELRPVLELEPQHTLKQARYLQLLSLGVITDEQFHLDMMGQLPPDGAPELSGTGFMDAAEASVDAEGVSPNDDSLGRGLAPEGGKVAKSKAVKKKPSGGSKLSITLNMSGQ